MSTRHQPDPLRELWSLIAMLFQFGGILIVWIIIAVIALAVLGKLFS